MTGFELGKGPLEGETDEEFARRLKSDFVAQINEVRARKKENGEVADKVFYSLCEDDILEVATALDEELTEEEMTRAKEMVADGMGDHWWGVTEDVIAEIGERRESDVSSESSD